MSANEGCCVPPQPNLLADTATCTAARLPTGRHRHVQPNLVRRQIWSPSTPREYTLKRQPVVISSGRDRRRVRGRQAARGKEARIRAELANGRTIWDISDFNALLRRKGIGNQP
jgi:hypothetical protein